MVFKANITVLLAPPCVGLNRRYAYKVWRYTILRCAWCFSIPNLHWFFTYLHVVKWVTLRSGKIWSQSKTMEWATVSNLVHVFRQNHLPYRIILFRVSYRDRRRILKRCSSGFAYLTPAFSLMCQIWCFVCWVRILVQVTKYRRLLIGRDGHLDQSEAYDIS